MFFFNLILSKIKYKQFYRNEGYGNHQDYNSRFEVQRCLKF